MSRYTAQYHNMHCLRATPPPSLRLMARYVYQIPSPVPSRRRGVCRGCYQVQLVGAPGASRPGQSGLIGKSPERPPAGSTNGRDSRGRRQGGTRRHRPADRLTEDTVRSSDSVGETGQMRIAADWSGRVPLPGPCRYQANRCARNGRYLQEGKDGIELTRSSYLTTPAQLRCTVLSFSWIKHRTRTRPV